MKFRDFVSWCNNRACDGCWGMKRLCCASTSCSRSESSLFGDVKKEWRRINEGNWVVTMIVDPINAKIAKVKGRE